MTKSAIIRHSSDKIRHSTAIFRHAIPHNSLTSSEAERVLCAFYVRKKNFFGHKDFDSMLFRFFIPRLRVGRATQWPRFWRGFSVFRRVFEWEKSDGLWYNSYR